MAFWRALRWGLYVAVLGVLRWLPPRMGLLCGRALGWLAFAVLADYRSKAVANVAAAFPGLGARGARRVARASFSRLGEAFAVSAALARLSRERRAAAAEVVGISNLRGALARGRGVVVVTAHLGCWELLPAFLAASGLRTRLMAEAQAGRLETLLLRAERAKLGVVEVGAGYKSLRSAARLLEEGGALVCAVDRPARGEGLEVPFLGGRSRLPSLPLRMARMTGAEVVPAYTIPVGGCQVIFFEEGVRVIAGSEMKEKARALASLVEGWIRRAPEHWVWFDVKWEA